MNVSGIEGEALSIFKEGHDKVKAMKKSALRCYIAGYEALEKAGYIKVSGKWVKNEIKVKLQKMERRDEDKRLVFGFFSIVELQGKPVTDSQGDVILEKDLEEAVYKYVKNSRMGDDRHDNRCKAVLVESMLFTKEKQKSLGIDLGFSGWWGGFYVQDDAMWQKIKTGEYESFSIGGTGKYESID